VVDDDDNEEDSSHDKKTDSAVKGVRQKRAAALKQKGLKRYRRFFFNFCGMHF